MLQTQTVLQHFYKMLMWPTSYWFSSKSTINITFSFTTTSAIGKKNYKIICISKIIVSLALFLLIRTYASLHLLIRT